MTLYITSTQKVDRLMRNVFRRFYLTSGSSNASLLRTVPEQGLLVIALQGQNDLTGAQIIHLRTDPEVVNYSIGG